VAVSGLVASDVRAALSLAGLSAVTATALAASAAASPWAAAAGQLLLAPLLWSWFSVLHSAGHGAYFRTPVLNVAAGHIASALCLVPFYPWRYHHAAHHRWTGWRDLDPTTDEIPSARPPARVLRRLELCWRAWIPVFSLGHVLGNFWNPPRIRRLTASAPRYRRCLASMTFVPLVHAGALAVGFPLPALLALPLLAFLVSSDPVLLSQHALLPADGRADGKAVAPLPTAAQERLARTIRFHPLVDRWVFLNFNLHSVHHLHPTVPHYHLHRIAFDPTHDVTARDWIRHVKSLRAETLIWGPA
jgi:fatty acid desaturase